jgi:hypothetical protein
MANHFRFYGASIDDTSEQSLITVTGSSNFIIGSVLLTNTTTSTDGNVTLTVYDSSNVASYHIIKSSATNRGTSREVLSRPLALETNDELRITCSVADVYDVLISYLDRDRD